MKRLASLLALAGCAVLASRALAAPNPDAPDPGADAPEPPPPAAAPASPPTAPPAPAPAAAPPAAPAPAPPYGWGQWQAQPGATAPVDAEPEKPLPPPGPPRWQAWLGVRNTWVANSGFDPFATDNALTQFSLGGSRSLLSRDRFSLAAGLTFDGGTVKASARGAPTELETYRLLVAPEIRWIAIPQLYFFARPAAGAVRTSASLEEATSGVTLYSRAWRIAWDADAGAAFAFADLRSTKTELRFWAIADGGYAWTQSQHLTMSPDDGSGAPVRTASLDLGTLGLRGPYFRVAVAATF